MAHSLKSQNYISARNAPYDIMLRLINFAQKYNFASKHSVMQNAARFGNVAALRALFESKFCVNDINDNYKQVLFIAALNQQIDCVNYLLSQGADQSMAKDELEKLIRNGILQEPKNSNLIEAVSNNNKKEVEKELAQPHVNINGKTKTGWSPLAIAVFKQYWDIARLLLKRKDIRIGNPIQEDQNTELHLAINARAPDDILKKMLGHTCGIDAVNNEGQTPLSLALDGNNISHIRLLIEHGAHPVKELKRLEPLIQNRLLDKQIIISKLRLLDQIGDKSVKESQLAQNVIKIATLFSKYQQ